MMILLGDGRFQLFSVAMVLLLGTAAKREMLMNASPDS